MKPAGHGYEAQPHNARLLERLSSDGNKIALAFSGGTDSAYLLKMTLLAGINVTPFFMISPFVSKRERHWINFASKSLNVTPVEVTWDPFKEQNLIKNDALRCYHCKRTMYGKLMAICRGQGIRYIYDGTQADDLRSDDRPGLLAIKELGIKTPLADSGFSKTEIREQSRQLDLPTWDRPSQSCLATRIAYGQPLTSSLLTAIETAEDFLQDIGIYPVRFKISSDIVELKCASKDDDLVKKFWRTIENKVKSLGFKKINLSNLRL